MYNSISKS